MGYNLWTKQSPSWLEENLGNFEKELYKEWVEIDSFSTYSNKTTVVIIKLKSGFEIVGTAGCEDPSKFNQNMGYTCALQDALRKLGEFAAFWRTEDAYRKKQAPKELRMSIPLSPEQIEQVKHIFRSESAKMTTSSVNIAPYTADIVPSEFSIRAGFGQPTAEMLKGTSVNTKV